MGGAFEEPASPHACKSRLVIGLPVGLREKGKHGHGL